MINASLRRCRASAALLAAFERTWEKSEEFRRAHRRLTFGFGAALALDSVLRGIIVYAAPVER